MAGVAALTGQSRRRPDNAPRTSDKKHGLLEVFSGVDQPYLSEYLEIWAEEMRHYIASRRIQSHLMSNSLTKFGHFSVSVNWSLLKHPGIMRYSYLVSALGHAPLKSFFLALRQQAQSRPELDRARRLWLVAPGRPC